MTTTIFQNDFEGQTDGVAATVANSVASGDAFQAVLVGTGAAVKYSAAAAVEGSMGLRIEFGSTQSRVQFLASGTDGRRAVIRRSFVYDGTPPLNELWLGHTQGSVALGWAGVRPGGGGTQFQAGYAGAVSITASRFVLPSPGTYWFELASISSTDGTDGTVEYRLYAADGSTLLHSWSSGSTLAMNSGNPSNVRFGTGASSSGWTRDDMDQIRAMFTDDLDAWLGTSSRVLAPPTGVTVEEITAPTGLDTNDGTIRVSWDESEDPDAGHYDVGLATGLDATSGFTVVGSVPVGADPLEYVIADLAPNQYTVAVRTSPGQQPGGSWAAALENLDNARARILWVGDSLLEGQGASTWALRPSNRLLGLLNTRHGVSEPQVSPFHRFYNAGLGSASWGTLGTVSDPAGITRDETYSMSKRGMAITAGNYWIAPDSPYDFRYVEVTFTEATGLGMSGGCHLVDLAGPTTLATIDTTAGDAGPGKRFVFDYGSIGARTVGVNPQTGLAIVDSIAFYQTHPDTGPGFAIADSSCPGIGSNAALTGSAPESAWPNTGADLVIDDLWHNDYIGDQADPATSAARFIDRVDAYRAMREDIDIVLVMLWNAPLINPVTPNGLGYTIGDYRAAMLAAAASSEVEVFNLADHGTPDAGWFTADGVHHNDSGHAQWVGLLDTFLASLG